VKKTKEIKINNKNQFGAEILCIGSEILLGNIVNTNSQWIAEKLASLGIPHFRQTVIGDNPDRLKGKCSRCKTPDPCQAFGG